MSKTIVDLWNGNLCPIRFLDVRNEEMRQIEQRQHNKMEKLEATLDDEQKKMFEIYTECEADYLVVLTEEAFCAGFSLATKIITEALYEAQSVVGE